MSKPLTLEDIDPRVRDKIYQQDYSPKPSIDGVKIINLNRYIGEDGDFCELARLTAGQEIGSIPGFKLSQINWTRLEPGTIKAWHLHLKQDEIWYLSPKDRLFVGLWDVRDASKSKDVRMRLILGGGNSQLLFIPKGVAHGYANFEKKASELLYFVSETFDPKNPDEQRISWDALGDDFWLPKRD